MKKKILLFITLYFVFGDISASNKQWEFVGCPGGGMAKMCLTICPPFTCFYGYNEWCGDGPITDPPLPKPNW